MFVARGVEHGAKRERGFTILELIIVIGLLGVLYSIAAVSFSGVMPKYRLRSTARQLGTTLEQIRLAALGRGLWMGIRYVLNPTAAEDKDRPYYQTIPPPPEDNPDQPLDQRDLLMKQYLEPGVRFSRIVLSGNDTLDSGTVDVLFSPMGNAGSHIVVLEGDGGRIVSLKLNSITGILDFMENAEASFQHHEE